MPKKSHQDKSQIDPQPKQELEEAPVTINWDELQPEDDDPDPDGLGWEEHNMDLLVKALKAGEKPNKQQIKRILENTMRIEIPEIVSNTAS